MNEINAYLFCILYIPYITKYYFFFFFFFWNDITNYDLNKLILVIFNTCHVHVQLIFFS